MSNFNAADAIVEIDRYVNALSGIYVRKDSELLTEEDRKVLNDLIANDYYADNCRRFGGMWERFHTLDVELANVRSTESYLIDKVDHKIDYLMKLRRSLSEE